MTTRRKRLPPTVVGSRTDATVADIGWDEWRAALGNSVERPDPRAKTIAELSDELGLCRMQMYRKVRDMIAAGTATRTTKIITMVTGAARRVPAYRLVKRP